MQKLVDKVNERLGFGQQSYHIDLKIFRHIVRACYFEFAILDQNSGWCSLLTDNEHKLLEYLDDIEDYYEDAYGMRTVDDILERIFITYPIESIARQAVISIVNRVVH